jgi:hypothetical protein
MKQISKWFAGFFAAAAGALVVCAIFHFQLLGRAASPDITVSNTPVNRDARPVASFAPVVKTAAPSVVYIYSTRIVRF